MKHSMLIQMVTDITATSWLLRSTSWAFYENINNITQASQNYKELMIFMLFYQFNLLPPEEITFLQIIVLSGIHD